ncbi:MAG: type I-U CRISPR-associated protein Csb2 [Desulfosalsimonas sp.]
MLTIAFTFPSGKYHATPWGRHVNEADLAWPPDLWRICRAFIAVWHRKLDQDEHPKQNLHDLLSCLAGEAPHYRLPEGIHFHTRHYMPIKEGKKKKRTLIFDAFARVDRKDPLIVHWPSLTLSEEQTRLLDALLFNLGYLGRAESWVEAQRIEKWDGEYNCPPKQYAAGSFTEESDQDQITMLMPGTPEDYQERGKRLRNEILEQEKSLVDKKQKKSLKEALRTLPGNWLDALSLDTGELQKAGWSAPPAAVPTAYLRPKNALRFIAPRAIPPARAEAGGMVTTARYAVYAKPLPRITDALLVGEKVRLAAMGLSKRLLNGEIPVALSGHADAGATNHAHAFFLPEDTDGDGRIDHILVHAPMGLDRNSRIIMAALNRIRTKEGIDWQLLLEAMGERSHFSTTADSLLAGAEIWQSVTPYLHPWHRKKKFGIDEQIQKECRLRNIPEPAAIEPVNPKKPQPLDFRRFRSKRGIMQPDRHGCFLRLSFSEPVQGPLALGFACHFGLGLFAPAG